MPLLMAVAHHFSKLESSQWTNVRAMCSSFCNATVNDSGFCPAMCLADCPATCLYILISPTNNDAAAFSARRNTKTSYTLDPFFIATFASLAIGFFAICSYAVYLKYYSKRRRRRPGPRSEQEAELSGHVNCEPNSLGLASSVIGAVTIHKYMKGDALFRETECVVCLNEFQDGEVLRILPNCNHAFHMACVDLWLGSHISCPMCRAGIVSKEPASEDHFDPV